jgi:hypothetical protein
MSKNRSLVAVSCLVVAGCSSAPTPDTSAPPAGETREALTPGVASSASSPSTETSHEEWRRAMAHSVPATGGCFTASHPSTTWTEVPCAKGPDHPFIPARGFHSHLVGGNLGGDFYADQNGNAITSAEGAFPVLTGVTSQNESFSLQINSEPANVGYCTPHLQDPGSEYCENEWQQFVYSDGWLLMQYWLIGVHGACPSGWNSATVGNEADCWINDAKGMVAVTPFPLADLGEVTLTAVAGTTDSVTLAVGTALTAVSQTSFLGLSSWWNAAEFNVFGPGGGEEVVLDPGSTILVRELVDGAQTPNMPTCGSESFTGETNSLSLVPNSCCALQGPAGIQFTESNVSGTAAPGCPGPNWCRPERCFLGQRWEGAPYCQCVPSRIRLE